jgi:transposase
VALRASTAHSERLGSRHVSRGGAEYGTRGACVPQAQTDAEGRALLKGQRYNLLRNPENLSTDGRRELKLLLAANRDLSIVNLLKDAFKAVWTYTYRRSADKCLTNWTAMAVESGVGELARFARGLIAAKEQILNFCVHRIFLTFACAEGVTPAGWLARRMLAGW